MPPGALHASESGRLTLVHSANFSGVSASTWPWAGPRGTRALASFQEVPISQGPMMGTHRTWGFNLGLWDAQAGEWAWYTRRTSWGKWS